MAISEGRVSHHSRNEDVGHRKREDCFRLTSNPVVERNGLGKVAIDLGAKNGDTTSAGVVEDDRFRRSQRNTTKAIVMMRMTPPAIPPATAPTFVRDFLLLPPPLKVAEREDQVVLVEVAGRADHVKLEVVDDCVSDSRDDSVPLVS